MWYSIKKTNYSFEIKKLKDTNDNLEVYFTKLLSCNPMNEESDKINYTLIENLDTITLPTCHNCKEDNPTYGLYKLHIKLGNHYDSIIVPYYPLVLRSLIKDMENLFCGCPCPKCDDCIESEELLNITFKTLLYFSITGSYYNEKLSKALRCIGCNLDKEMLCLLVSEKIYGSYTNKKFLKKILATFYIALYKSEITKDCNKEYHNDLFNYDKIKKCLSELGLDLDCLDNAFKNEDPITGDRWVFIDNRSRYIITKKDFIETDPPYNDYENNPIRSIKITSINLDSNSEINSSSKLQLDGIDVIVGQIISMIDIEDNKLVFISRDTNRSSESIFTWEVYEENKCS